jgi:hypothetical protein
MPMASMGGVWRYDAAALPWHESPSISPAGPGPDHAQCILRAMVALLTRSRPNSDAEALRLLRDSFPEASLAMRVAAFTARTSAPYGRG